MIKPKHVLICSLILHSCIDSEKPAVLENQNENKVKQSNNSVHITKIYEEDRDSSYIQFSKQPNSDTKAKIHNTEYGFQFINDDYILGDYAYKKTVEYEFNVDSGFPYLNYLESILITNGKDSFFLSTDKLKIELTRKWIVASTPYYPRLGLYTIYKEYFNYGDTIPFVKSVGSGFKRHKNLFLGYQDTRQNKDMLGIVYLSDNRNKAQEIPIKLAKGLQKGVVSNFVSFDFNKKDRPLSIELKFLFNASDSDHKNNEFKTIELPITKKGKANCKEVYIDNFQNVIIKK